VSAVAERFDAEAFWIKLNTRLDHHIAKGAAHEAAIDATLGEIRAGWDEQARFLETWNAMTYREAVAFQRENSSGDLL
jgi:hypothetical protein